MAIDIGRRQFISFYNADGKWISRIRKADGSPLTVDLPSSTGQQEYLDTDPVLGEAIEAIKTAKDQSNKTRRFPPRWSIEESAACFIVRKGDKQTLAYVYFENEPGRRSTAKLLTLDEVFLIAVNIAKLPSVPRQILKDIPRPPNSASRDD